MPLLGKHPADDLPSSTFCVLQRVIVYPAYIDSKKTIAGGRKITKAKGLLSLSVLPLALAELEAAVLHLTPVFAMKPARTQPPWRLWTAVTWPSSCKRSSRSASLPSYPEPSRLVLFAKERLSIFTCGHDLVRRRRRTRETF